MLEINARPGACGSVGQINGHAQHLFGEFEVIIQLTLSLLPMLARNSSLSFETTYKFGAISCEIRQEDSIRSKLIRTHSCKLNF